MCYMPLPLLLLLRLANNLERARPLELQDLALYVCDFEHNCNICSICRCTVAMRNHVCFSFGFSQEAIDPPSRKSLQSTCFLAHSDTRWYVKSLPSVLPDSSDEENDGHPPVARPRRTG